MLNILFSIQKFQFRIREDKEQADRKAFSKDAFIEEIFFYQIWQIAFYMFHSYQTIL